jgi:hypothetical protein
MVFDEVLAEFRRLGGVAENVRLGEGKFGRGIFVVDPSAPATLHAPENILVPADEVEVRDGNLVLRNETALGPAERAFFETLHRSFGWGAGLFEEIWQAQESWSRLPSDVVTAIANMGGTFHPQMRFVPPSSDICFYHFIKSRDFSYDGKFYIAPLIDLVNHSSGVPTYVLENGIGVAGRFADEMLVCYNLVDAWAYAIVYGFLEPAPQAYSLAITVELYGRHKLTINRDVGTFENRQGIRFPAVEIEGNTIVLSHLLLGQTNVPDLPRGLFRQIMQPYVNAAQADEVFDSIARFNRSKFIALLRTLRQYDTPLVRMLEEAAINQLEALAACVGARAL